MGLARILVTGANGQVGTELVRGKWPSAMTVRGLKRSDLDITDRDAVMAVVSEWQPDLAVSYTHLTLPTTPYV